MRHNMKLFNALGGLPMNTFEPHNVANQNYAAPNSLTPKLLKRVFAPGDTVTKNIQTAISIIDCELVELFHAPLNLERCDILARAIMKHSAAMDKILQGVQKYLGAQGSQA